MDNRGLAAGILKFIAYLAFFALLYGVFQQFVPSLFGEVGLSATSSETAELQTYTQMLWTALPAIVVFMLAIRLIARAVFESRGGVP